MPDEGLLELLRIALPSAAQTTVLRAALLGRAGNGEAVDAAVIDPDARVHRLLALVDRAVKLHGLPVSPRSRIHLTAAAVREHARAETVRELCGDALERLRAKGIGTIVLKGVAASETAYPLPTLRHCHDLDLLVDSRTGAVEALRGWFEKGADDSVLRHVSGFPISLHTQLFAVEPFGGAIPKPFEQTATQIVAGSQAKVLAPSAFLLHTLAHAATFGSRTGIHWASDAYFVIGQHGIDWNWIRDAAESGHMAAQIWLMLDYLARSLEADIPRETLESLRVAAEREERRAREASIACLLTAARGNPVDLVRMAGNWRRRLRTMRWLVLPPREYVWWMEGCSANVRFYTRRSARFLSQSLRERI
jgi:hypothetical protein